jgi:biopolymer transport protein ExbD
MRARSHQHDQELEFQIAPMIDVLLVILVFFITITSASVLRLNLKLQLPVASNAAKKVNTPNEILVNAVWEAKTSTGFASMMNPLNGQERRYENMDELTDTLKLVIKDKQWHMVLRADRNTPAKFIQGVIRACAGAGLIDVTFSAISADKNVPEGPAK